ncbi:MAG: hypothetical protein AAF586_01665, partial [Planctomycetota bacterium]
DLFENICLVATNAKHSPWGVAFNASQRLALAADPTLKYTYDGAGESGLKAARAIAMLSYRNQGTYALTQTDDDSKIDDFKASSYQAYQGDKLVKRFSPHAYWVLSKAMDSHNIATASTTRSANTSTTRTFRAPSARGVNDRAVREPTPPERA